MLELFTQFLEVRFSNPSLLWWGIPFAAILLLFLLTRDLVNVPLSSPDLRRQRARRIIVFVFRLLLVSALLCALAHPFIERTEEVQGNPRVTILIDKSASMANYDTGYVDALTTALQKKIPTTVKLMGTNLSSDLGSSMLRNLEPGGNLLLITDGNVNAGPSLSDVAFYATTLNATINAIELSALKDDAAVVIVGPSKVVADSDATFEVRVSATHTNTVHLLVSVDGSQILEKDVTAGSYPFTQRFVSGNHRIEARITTVDAQPDSNSFSKAIDVLAKPKILLLSQTNSPLELLLRELYDVDKKPALPADLSPYYAIIGDNVPVETLRNTQALHTYLLDEQGEYYGGGFVLFGGMTSFDRGDYAGSSLEPLLPVRVGKGERKKGGANLVFIMDASGSTSKTKYQVVNGQWTAYNESVPTLDVIKAQMLNAIQQIQIDNKVGVIVFGIPPDTSTDSIEQRISSSVRVVAPLDFLFNNRKQVEERVSRVVGGGPSADDVALRGAIDMLKGLPGDRNIIMLTDGRFSIEIGEDSPAKQELLNLAANGHKLYGINFVTVGVGATDPAQFATKVDEKFLKQFAAAGYGTYDRATQLNSLLIKWGDPKAKEFGQEFGLVPLSLNHFITRDIEPSAVLNGYNQVVPKDTAELLIAADTGQPALTVWRYGNGRVATWTVFSGNNLGQLLNKENSLLISRTVNWAIGDPQRKEPYFVDIPDLRINERGSVRVRSDSPVTAEGLVFTKEGKDYVAAFEPTQIGFGTLLGRTYAVNRPSEFDAAGVNPEIERVVTASGGKVFKPSESEAIIEHVKQMSRRVTVIQKDMVTPFLVVAMTLFLLEIALRRLTERRHD